MTATSPHYYVWQQCHSKAAFISLTVNRERFAYMRDSFHLVIHDVACNGLVLQKNCSDEHRIEMKSDIIWKRNV
ncbi:hypothetical protein OUZ56_011409 [Daphnia magna]|uniref:Uncharacterized protein n=1 Tax=Daphnia magna TaxID=35525 RepID=A0ABQ9Z019_9CRUS|nr:hypothetical protein OUZ56_011409 [Daphnia magna]